jgi:hypothetical protein
MFSPDQWAVALPADRDEGLRALQAAIESALRITVEERYPRYLSESVQTLVAAGKYPEAAWIIARHVEAALPADRDEGLPDEWKPEGLLTAIFGPRGHHTPGENESCGGCIWWGRWLATSDGETK